MGTMTTIGDAPVYEVPAGVDCKGGLIVIHEVWGLTDHIKDVAERFANEGYLVIAPDLLSETDIDAHATTSMQQDLFNPEKRNAIQPKLRELMAPLQTPQFAVTTAAKVRACFDYLYEQSDTHQRVAVVGYCFGGSYSFTLASEEPRLQAAVPYYGHADLSTEQLAAITCPILAFYGEQDERLLASLPKLEEAMHQARIDFTAEVYTEAGHAFFNDTNPYAYKEKAAHDAWLKTLDFLSQNMRS